MNILLIVVDQAQYTIKKNGHRLISGTSDVCQELQKNNGKDLAAALTKYGLPDKCPVDEVIEFQFSIRKI